MIKFLRKILPLFNKPEKAPEPLFPKSWKLTLDDLMDEMAQGKRNEIKEPEMTWAREYERSTILSHYRFPKRGDLYQAKFDQQIFYLTFWSAPYTGGTETIIYKGEKVWVYSDPLDQKPINVNVLPVDYDELEMRIVPLHDRIAPLYNGFAFSISTKVINENFELIETNFQSEQF